MKKSRKLGLQSLALVLMAFVLVAGVAFGMTGAWFTSTQTKTDTFTFGNVEIALADLNGTIGTRTVNASYAADDLIMPGDTISFTVAVSNEGNQKVWYVAYVELTDDLQDANVDSTYATGAYYVYTGSAWTVATNSNLVMLDEKDGTNDSVTGDLSINLTGATYGDIWESKIITATVTVYAVQAANVEMGTAYTMLTTRTGEGSITFEVVSD